MDNTAMEQQRLPSHVTPIFYDLKLFDLCLQVPFSYRGEVRIHIAVKRPTDTIWLNAKEITVTGATAVVGAASSPLECNHVVYDPVMERVALQFPIAITGSEAQISVRFDGTINNTFAGFYHSSTQETPDVFSTMFESCHARRAFPCFDEPNLKATFRLSIQIPKHLMALSNMPEREVVERTDGTKIVSFDTTPLMSTYLLAWAIGEFEYVEGKTNQEHQGNLLPIRVYTTKGLISQASYALKHSCRVMDYFANAFKMDYPLPKLDLIVIPHFSHGAMENWGLCTFQGTAMLIDESTSTLDNHERVSYVIAHELAHQWFGNLVTMDWWNDLWLKEGFATWAGWLATSHFHPDWDVWTRFVSEGLQAAFQLDSLRASHPIDVCVGNGPEIDEIFDDISYLKGSALVRMLVNYLGSDTLLEGIANYFSEFAYGNAKSDDLWRHLSKSSGKDVQSFMDPWINQIGFPVVTVEADHDCLHLQQERLLLTNDLTQEESRATWPISLQLPNAQGGWSTQDLRAKACRVKLDSEVPIWQYLVKLNPDRSGFYRMKYSTGTLRTLADSLNDLTIVEKTCLIADTTTAAIMGKGSTVEVLTFLERFRCESNYFLWLQISRTLDILSSVFSGCDSLSHGLINFQRMLVENAASNMSWDVRPDEEHTETKLRSLIVRMAGRVNHQETTTKALELFQMHVTQKVTIHSSLVPAIFTIATAQADPKQYKAVKSIYLNAPSTSPDVRETCLKALGSAVSESDLGDYLSMLLSPDVQVSDLAIASSALATRSFTRKAFWEWLKENWSRLLQRFNASLPNLVRFLCQGLNGFAEEGYDTHVENFFRVQNCSEIGFARGLEVVLENIRVNAGFRAREEKILETWMKEMGYLNE